MSTETRAEDIKIAPPPWQGRKVRIDPLSRYHLVSPLSCDNGLQGANTPGLGNGSTRWKLLSFPGTFDHHSSQGSFRLPLILTRTNRQLSVIRSYPTFLVHRHCTYNRL